MGQIANRSTSQRRNQVQYVILPECPERQLFLLLEFEIFEGTCMVHDTKIQLN